MVAMAPPEVIKLAIRCTGRRPDGRLCDHLLLKVRADKWEQALTDAIEGKCPRCGRIYNLSEWV